MHDLFDVTNQEVLPFKTPEGDGYSVKWIEALRVFLIKIPNGEILYSRNFLSKKISDRAIQYFLENDIFDVNTNWREVTKDDFLNIKFRNIKWKQDSIKLYGKNIPLPRLTSWYGDKGLSYTYSGINSQPNDWNDGLLYIKKEIENIAGVSFNSVLLNWYRDGDDYLNWHSDDEKELGINPVIASVNFGETRDFIIRKNDNNSEKITIPLEHGTMLVMRGEMQHFWQHCVPKRKKINGSRFNLTFRIINHRNK